MVKGSENAARIRFLEAAAVQLELTGATPIAALLTMERHRHTSSSNSGSGVTTGIFRCQACGYRLPRAQMAASDKPIQKKADHQDATLQAHRRCSECSSKNRIVRTPQAKSMSKVSSKTQLMGNVQPMKPTVLTGPSSSTSSPNMTHGRVRKTGKQKSLRAQLAQSKALTAPASTSSGLGLLDFLRKT